MMTCNSCYTHSAKCNLCDFHHQYSGNKMQSNDRRTDWPRRTRNGGNRFSPTTCKHQLKNKPWSPLALVVACAMRRKRLLSGWGMIEYHLPSVLSNSIQIYVRKWQGSTPNKWIQFKNEHCPPPLRLSFPVWRRGHSFSLAGQKLAKTTPLASRWHHRFYVKVSSLTVSYRVLVTAQKDFCCRVWARKIRLKHVTAGQSSCHLRCQGDKDKVLW